MTLLESISGPGDLKELSPDELPQLAAEIRDFLIQAVSVNGGHLGPILADVGLTPQHLAREITEAVARRTPELAHDQRA